MDGRMLARLGILAVLALSTVMCSVFTPAAQNPNSPAQGTGVKETLAVLQSTIDFMQKQSQATAYVWMTEAASASGGLAGTPELPTEQIGKGKIEGKLTFSGDTLPPMRVVAFNVETSEYFTTEINNNGTYSLEVPAGQYQVVAYLINKVNGSKALAGGYTQAVPCGLSVTCTDHSLITLEVKSGATVGSIDPGDWYAPPGTFPPDPISGKS
jgi:hypothetical protein